MLKVMGASDAVRYIHLGWILALIAGGLTWVATQTFLTFSGQHRESMEGFISVFAAVALFYVGYWLHTRSEAKKWQAFIRGKVQNVVSGKKILGLVGISFFAVYREAFEVVLFYQALWLQNESGHHLIVSGFVAGLAVLVVVDLRDLEARAQGSAEVLSSASPALSSTSSPSSSPATASRNCKPLAGFRRRPSAFRRKCRCWASIRR